MLTKADWREIWEQFDRWFAEQSGVGPDWWEQQQPKIVELVNAKLRARTIGPSEAVDDGD